MTAMARSTRKNIVFRFAAPDDDEDCCRICGDNGDEEPLIEPCACQGTMRFVHASCLNKWRQESLNNGRAQNAVQCEVRGRGLRALPGHVERRSV